VTIKIAEGETGQAKFKMGNEFRADVRGEGEGPSTNSSAR
jgi:hypothetical protein